MHIDDIIKHFRFISSRTFLDLFESQITAQVKLARKQGKRVAWWSVEVRQHLRYAMFLRYYAAFEKHLKVICDRMAQSESLQVRLSDLKGENFLSTVNKYVTRIAHREPLDKHPAWHDALTYLWIRNQIVHHDGQVNDTNIPLHVKQRLKIGAIGARMTPDRQIRLNRRFCYRAIRLMAALLVDVADRERSESPRGAQIISTRADD